MDRYRMEVSRQGKGRVVHETKFFWASSVKKAGHEFLKRIRAICLLKEAGLYRFKDGRVIKEFPLDVAKMN